MKKYLTIFLVTWIVNLGNAQEKVTHETEENFSLEGALALFKKSNSLEEFEQYINSENNEVNNLDLNNDGTIDYISVNDITNEERHTLVLSAHLAENEKQEIATLIIEKTGTEEAQLQFFGDETLFGPNTIVEPFDVKEQLDTNFRGPSLDELRVSRVIVNVWFWPSVRYMFAPSYPLWVSPYRWAYYPKWWKPWHPVRYSIFVGRNYHYKSYYNRTNIHRVKFYNDYSYYKHKNLKFNDNKKSKNISVGKHEHSRKEHFKRR